MWFKVPTRRNRLLLGIYIAQRMAELAAAASREASCYQARTEQGQVASKGGGNVKTVGVKKFCVALPLLSLFSMTLAQEKNNAPAVYLNVDCTDTVGSNSASALRERIRGSNGYTLGSGATKEHSGFEIILTCVAIPGHERAASAVSYVFDVFVPDGARYFVSPGIGVVGADGVDGWARNVFSQFDNYASSVQKTAAH